MKFKTIAYTETGKRAENQDNVLVCEKDNITLMSVADGMGGHIGGAKASEIVNETLKDLFDRTTFPDTSHQTMQKWLEFASNKAKENLDTFVQKNEEYSDMGSTLVAALLTEDMAHILNIGDSRAYVYYDGELNQITSDQNLRQHLINTQTINISDYSKNAFSNVLMSSLGPTKKVEKDWYKVNLQDGMTILLTSDGVHDYMDARIMKGIISKKVTLKQKAKTLVDVALEGKSNDNLSVVMAKSKI